MPTVPKSNKCRELGCDNPQTHRSCFCAQHGGGTTDKGKKNSKLYSSKAWLNARQAQLSKEPLCARCLHEGRITQGEHIDHVIPHRQDYTKFHVALLQTLCASCHTLKTQEESKGVYLHYTPNGIKEYKG
jgi:5-methylcytosine-specific restriction protein A